MLELLIEPLQQALLGPDALKYWSIPIIAGLIGLFTNWLAIQLTFHPLEFVGIKPFFGWQGIIPSKIEKMANIVVDKSISKLGTLSELFKEMEPDKIAAHLIESTSLRIEEYTDEIMLEKNPVLWENLPAAVKRRLYARARKLLPTVIDQIVSDMTDQIEDLVDVRQMIVDQLTTEKSLMNRVFQEVGSEEFTFLIRSGLYFGMAFGVIQMLVWIFYPMNWVLPFFGFLVGYATNWIALNFIFRPLYPVTIKIPFLGEKKFQGLFLKRQHEVAETYCFIVTREILTLRHLMHTLMNGSRSARAHALIKKHLKPLVESGIVKTVAQITVGPSGYVNLKRSIENKAIEVSTYPFDDPAFNMDRAELVAKLFYERMVELSPSEFQDLLRPAFQEDEWILILTGALLGLGAGIAQLLIIFGGNMV